MLWCNLKIFSSSPITSCDSILQLSKIWTDLEFFRDIILVVPSNEKRNVEKVTLNYISSEKRNVDFRLQTKFQCQERSSIEKLDLKARSWSQPTELQMDFMVKLHFVDRIFNFKLNIKPGTQRRSIDLEMDVIVKVHLLDRICWFQVRFQYQKLRSIDKLDLKAKPWCQPIDLQTNVMVKLHFLDPIFRPKAALN